MRKVSRDHGLIHGEVFRLMGASDRGEFAWILEFPGLAGIEAWIGAEAAAPLAAGQRHDYLRRPALGARLFCDLGGGKRRLSTRWE